MTRPYSRKTINDMHELAKSKKGKCLSKIYLNAHSKLKWQCEFGHVWETVPNGIIYGNHWCPACANIRLGKRSALKDGFQKMNSLATSKGGKCLSKNYSGMHTKLKWQCEFGHIWSAVPTTIIHGKSWCPTCANITTGKKLTLKDGFERMNNLAINKGGKCLSKHYIAARTKYKWECSKGHIWEATYQSVKTSWCAVCGGFVKHTIEQMQQVAKDRGGKCLSKKYKDGWAKLKWQCSEGHTWFSSAINVYGKKETWCPKCAGKLKLTIEEMQQIAKDRGGKCLSKKYTDTHTRLEWQCSEGHTWRSSPNSIIHSKTWCPKCSGFFKEELCRTTFEQIFETKFLKYRPKWLISSAKGQMELDGYSKKYNMAFEYNGEQHFKKTYWISSDDLLKKRLIDDKLKEELCAKKGITLIVITYKNDLIKLPAFIKSQLKLKNLSFSNINFEKEIDFNKAYRHKPKIQEMRELAKERGGLCLSDKYIDTHTKLKWQCSEGHIWNAPPDSVKTGKHWCRVCAGFSIYTIEDIKKIARSRGGECLSKTYKQMYEKLKWQCSKGHIWVTKATNVIHGKTWCPKCAGRAPNTLEEMSNIAKDRGGKCLSKNQKFGAHTKLKWQCEFGHTWMATPSNVKLKKSWCRICADDKRFHHETIHGFN